MASTKTKSKPKGGLDDLESKRDSRRVAKSKATRSGWDDHLDEATVKTKGYSDYFFHGEKFYGKKDLILRGFEMATSFVKSMNLPFRPLLSVNKTESFSTGKVIALSTEVFDSELPDGVKLDVFIGLAIHECLHCEKTDFAALKLFIETLASRDKKLAALTKRIWNIIEDERIELSDVRENPGHGNFLAAVKDYMYNIDLEFEEGKDILRNLINFFTALIRYPDSIKPEMYASFKVEFKEVKKLLNPFPETSHEVFITSKKLAEFIFDLHRKLIEKEVKKKYLIVDDTDEPDDHDKEKSGGGGEPPDPDSDEIIPISKKELMKDHEDEEGGTPITEEEIINPEELDDIKKKKSEADSDETEGLPSKADDETEEETDESSDKGSESKPSPDDEFDETDDLLSGKDDTFETLPDDEGGDDEKRESKGTEPEDISEDDVPEGVDDSEDDLASGEAGGDDGVGKIDPTGDADGDEITPSPDGHLDPKLDEETLRKIEKEVESLVSEETSEMKSELEHDESLESTMGDKEVEASTALTDELVKEIMEEFAESLISSPDGNTRFLIGIGNEKIYNRESESVSNLASALSRMLRFNHRDMRIVNKGMRHGRLDTNRLAEAVQGVETIYETYGMVRSPKGAVALLIDESYSMHYDNKIQNARKAAIVLEKALDKNPDVDCYIYGHTADEDMHYGETTIRIYREKGRRIPFGIGGCMERNENRDGTAILETARRIRKLTDRPCILFVISDGEPCAYGYSGSSSLSDVKGKVREAEKLGFVVIQIAIYDSPNIGKMFNRFVIVPSIPDLPRKLGGIMKTVVSDLFKAKVSY